MNMRISLSGEEFRTLVRGGTVRMYVQGSDKKEHVAEISLQDIGYTMMIQEIRSAQSLMRKEQGPPSENPLLDLAVEVADGNPGAITVIKELQWFTHWDEILKYCKKSGLTGSHLWMKYKDVFHQDIHALGHWIEEQHHIERMKNDRPSSHPSHFVK